MDSITHALSRMIRHENERQQIEAVGNASIRPGLLSIRQRPLVHETYAGAAPEAQHIELRRCDELLTFWLELVSNGLSPPASMIDDGCDVILDRGTVHVYASTDGPEPRAWCATLDQPARQRGQRLWQEVEV